MPTTGVDRQRELRAPDAQHAANPYQAACNEDEMAVRSEDKTEPAKALGISSAAARLHNALTLALEHLDVVETVLTDARAATLSGSGRAGPSSALIGHAKTRNYEMAFHLLYTHLNAYIRALLHEMARKRPLEIVNKLLRRSLTMRL